MLGAISMGFGWRFLLMWYHCETFVYKAHSSCPLFCFSSFLFIGTFYYSHNAFFSIFLLHVTCLWALILHSTVDLFSLSNHSKILGRKWWSLVIIIFMLKQLIFYAETAQLFLCVTRFGFTFSVDCPDTWHLLMSPFCPGVGDKLTNRHHWRQRVDP